jgi:RNA polymerase sigma factor (sigma-70 family)
MSTSEEDLFHRLSKEENAWAFNEIVNKPGKAMKLYMMDLYKNQEPFFKLNDEEHKLRTIYEGVEKRKHKILSNLVMIPGFINILDQYRRGLRSGKVNIESIVDDDVIDENDSQEEKEAERRYVMRSLKKVLDAGIGKRGNGLHEARASLLDSSHIDQSVYYDFLKEINNAATRVKSLEKESPDFKAEKKLLREKAGLGLDKLYSILSDIQAYQDENKKDFNRVAENNIRLPVKFAKKYVNHGVQLLDLIQEGNMGLMKATEKFDYRKGYAFTTYATYWVRQAVGRAVCDHSLLIRIPVHIHMDLNKLNRIMRGYEELGRALTLEELSKMMNMPEPKVKKLLDLKRQEPISIDEPISKTGELDPTFLSDLIPDHDSVSPDNYVENEALKRVIENALSSLTEREAKILKMRYGLGDMPEHTLEEVGQHFKLTRERIRQIELVALRKLRHPDKSKHLQSFINSSN